MYSSEQPRDQKTGRFMPAPHGMRVRNKEERSAYSKAYYKAHRDDLLGAARETRETIRENGRRYDSKRFAHSVPVKLWVPRKDWEAMRRRGGSLAELIRTYIVWGLENDNLLR